MRRSFQAAGVVLVLAGAVAYAQPPQTASPRQWSQFRVAEYGFSIDFPAKPAQSTIEKTGEVRWMVELDNGWTAFLASTSLISAERVQSAGPLGVLDGAVKGGIAQFPGAVVTVDRPLAIGGNEGRELVLRIEHNGVPMLISSRVVLVKQRLYVYTAVTKTTHDPLESERFLKSFALISP